jgi:hypothetical protein
MSMTVSTSAVSGSASSGIWTVHSEADGRPGLRGFAKTKAEAEALLASLKSDDDDPRAEYWLIELSRDQLEDFKEAGLVPPGL